MRKCVNDKEFLQINTKLFNHRNVNLNIDLKIELSKDKEILRNQSETFTETN